MRPPAYGCRAAMKVFSIEVWVPPAGGLLSRTVRAGHWRRTPDLHEEAEAEELMRGAAREGVLTRSSHGGVEMRGHPLWFSKVRR